MCPLTGWASRADDARPEGCVSANAWSSHAMNMRAADAIVSTAPKAMKIFPISEVSSQVAFWLPATTTLGRGDGVSAWVTAGDVLPSSGCRERSRSLSWVVVAAWSVGAACGPDGLAGVLTLTLSLATVSAARSGLETTARRPAARIKAVRPPVVLVMLPNSPKSLSLVRERDPAGCRQRGGKRESSTHSRRKLGGDKLRAGHAHAISLWNQWRVGGCGDAPV